MVEVVPAQVGAREYVHHGTGCGRSGPVDDQVDRVVAAREELLDLKCGEALRQSLGPHLLGHSVLDLLEGRGGGLRPGNGDDVETGVQRCRFEDHWPAVCVTEVDHLPSGRHLGEQSRARRPDPVPEETPHQMFGTQRRHVLDRQRRQTELSAEAGVVLDVRLPEIENTDGVVPGKPGAERFHALSRVPSDNDVEGVVRCAPAPRGEVPQQADAHTCVPQWLELAVAGVPEEQHQRCRRRAHDSLSWVSKE